MADGRNRSFRNLTGSTQGDINALWIQVGH